MGNSIKGPPPAKFMLAKLGAGLGAVKAQFRGKRGADQVVELGQRVDFPEGDPS